MQHLWAPWRMPFIEGHDAVEGCLLCSKGAENKDVENHIVYRAERYYVMLNLYPYNSGHLMVIPYQHTGRLDDLDSESAGSLMSGAQLSLKVLEQALGPEGFNLGINQGKVSGAGIADHIHLHLVPRWNGDTNFMPVLAEAKVIPELLTRTAGKLRPVFAELGKSS